MYQFIKQHENDILSWADYVPQETLFWRRSIWEAVGGKLDKSFQFALDWDLLLRFRDAGARFARVPRFLGAFRVHPRGPSVRCFAVHRGRPRRPNPSGHDHRSRNRRPVRSLASSARQLRNGLLG